MLCDVEEDGVTGAVTVMVVNVFEVVEVDHNEGEVSAITSASGGFFVKLVVKGVVVDESGHAVGAGLLVDFIVEFDVGHGGADDFAEQFHWRQVFG